MASLKLPVFRDYIADKKLREFRRTEPERFNESIEFGSEKGMKLLEEYKQALQELAGMCLHCEQPLTVRFTETGFDAVCKSCEL